MKSRNKVGLVTLGLLVVIAAGLFYFQNNITDWVKLRGYTPESEIVELADQITLRPEYRRLFYVNRPRIADSATFNEHCRDNEFTIVLGCYLSGQRGIYLLDVQDERLEGIKQVTAAHELLHGAYERLSNREKERINTLLTQTYVNLTDKRIRDTVESYRKADPSVVSNELHSILGTEVRDLPDELESYYARYFTNRGKIVDFSDHYEQAFVERRNAVRDYDAQLAKLRKDIETRSTALEATDTALGVQREKMNQLRNDGKIDQYNKQVEDYNAKVISYNSELDKVQALVVKYNDIVEKRNQLAEEEAELVDAIDSRDVIPEQR